MQATRPVYFIRGKRTPFAKSMTSYDGISLNELLTQPMRALVQSTGLEGEIIGDVALGAVMNSAWNWNLAREATLSSGLHAWTPAYNVQRACGTGLETAWQVALKIASGHIDEGICGGADSASDLPLEVSLELRRWLTKFSTLRSLSEKIKMFKMLRPSLFKIDRPVPVEPRTHLSMGQHVELMVKEWEISRQEQDQLAFASHQKAATAYAEGFYKDQLVPFGGIFQDTNLRSEISLEKLSQLKPSFDRSETGTLTAGNSSPLTDGAAAVLLASEESSRRHNWTPLAKLVDFQAAAVDFVGGEGHLMAPTMAVSKLLERNNLKLQDFDYYEIHEAFAGQVLCTLKAWESDDYAKKFLQRSSALGPIDRTRLNIKGGSLALGHPFAATGARILTNLSSLIHERPGRGLVSISTAGGMGVAAIMESV